VRPIFEAAAADLGVPLRGAGGKVRYCGSFYGQTRDGSPTRHLIRVTAIVALLRGLPPGFTELGCHPGRAVDIDSMYGRERLAEVRSLCSRRVRSVIEERGIRMCSFADVRDRAPSRPVLRSS
jgi:predicted glycoside hydrolase/deacetylase ChbG (UPF0249 family)